MASELPKEFGPLVASGQLPPREQPERPSGMPPDEFFGRVAARAGLDRTAAARAADAVLEVLGERISGGQAATSPTSSRASSTSRCWWERSAAMARQRQSAAPR
jgi:uncharacterized protein (DUF2267 family)